MNHCDFYYNVSSHTSVIKRGSTHKCILLPIVYISLPLNFIQKLECVRFQIQVKSLENTLHGEKNVDITFGV